VRLLLRRIRPQWRIRRRSLNATGPLEILTRGSLGGSHSRLFEVNPGRVAVRLPDVITVL
jgi:hypothetical protein